MKKFFTLFLISYLFLLNAQTGVNTTDPKATLEVKAKTNGATLVEGLLIPNLSNAEILNMPVSSVHNGLMIYNNTKGCVQIYSSNQWSCVDVNQQGLSSYLNATYVGTTGTWVENFPADGNTITFKVNNNSSLSFSQLDFSSALQLTNAGAGLSYTPNDDYSNITINAGSSQTFTYTISGTPTSAGTLTANFNAEGGISAYGNISIAPQSGVRAIGMDFTGNYISNKQLDSSDHSVELTIRNFSNNALNNVDLSNIIKLTGMNGMSINPNQNTNVTIQPNEEITLDYTLFGIANNPGTLKASLEPNIDITGTVSASQQVELFDNVTANNLTIYGSYVFGQTMNPDNKVSLTLTNDNAFDLVQIDLSNAIGLSGAVNNIKINANQNKNIAIPANQSITITYTLDGTSLVQGGGILTATFSKEPFTTLSATKDVLGNNNFYATPNARTFTSSGGTYTFSVTSSLPWTASLIGDASNWITITNTTNNDVGDGTITITTTPKDSQVSQIGYIQISRNDGASINILINQPPTDSFNITNFSSEAANFVYDDSGSNNDNAAYYLSIHQDKTSTIYTNQSNLQLYGTLPSFIESINFDGQNIVFTPKERTNPGEGLSGYIRFIYGAGYISDPIRIWQNQKANQCPINSPMRADNGYKIWNSSQDFDPYVYYTQIETRTGINSFSDYSLYSNTDRLVGLEAQKLVVNTSNSSTLFTYLGSYEEPDIVSSFNSRINMWGSLNYHYKYMAIYLEDKVISSFANDSYYMYQLPDLSNAMVLTPVVCADGFDEDTPDVSGNAGWRL